MEAMIENFDKLIFERKVDVLVAMYVFNIKDISLRKIEGLNIWCPYYKGTNYYGYLLVPCYSTGLLTNAWNIVMKFEYCYLFRNKYYKKNQWECKLIYDDIPDPNRNVCDRYYALAETEQLVICYAGLKAVGFDVKGFLKEEGKV